MENQRKIKENLWKINGNMWGGTRPVTGTILSERFRGASTGTTVLFQEK